MPRVIVISNPTDLENEHERIHSLFENGLKYFHLRKPEKSRDELEGFLRKINPKYYKRIVIHSHYSLIEKYNLKGIHFPERLLQEESALELIKPLQRKGCSVSCSIHSIDYVSTSKTFNYMFLSPVFDSISKQDYKGMIDLDAVKLASQNTTIKLIALGGITATTFTDKISNAGFHGVALLGAIWNKSQEEATQELITIQSIASKLYNV